MYENSNISQNKYLGTTFDNPEEAARESMFNNYEFPGTHPHI